MWPRKSENNTHEKKFEIWVQDKPSKHRTTLKDNGYRVSSDLTIRQREELKVVKDRGLHGCFKNGKLLTKPRNDRQIMKHGPRSRKVLKIWKCFNILVSKRTLDKNLHTCILVGTDQCSTKCMCSLPNTLYIRSNLLTDLIAELLISVICFKQNCLESFQLRFLQYRLKTVVQVLS